jgi:hypothetical protein
MGIGRWGTIIDDEYLPTSGYGLKVTHHADEERSGDRGGRYRRGVATRARVLFVALLTALAAAVSAPSIARAEPPPDDEPSLFVVRAPARHDDGVLTVRTKKLEWFTDRPNRDAGRLTAKELADHWGGWGFEGDPPNAAVLGDGVDVIGELSKPRVRGGRLRFDFQPIRGKVENGSLGVVALLIDPSSPTQYAVRLVNNSSSNGSFAVYQTAFDAFQPLSPVVWFARYAFPTTSVIFQWDRSYQLMWSQTRVLQPGILFYAEQAWAADPSRGDGVTLTYDQSFTFTNQHSGLPAGTLGITTDNRVPLGQAAIGFGQAGSAAFVAPAQPNFVIQFRPADVQYWVVFGDFFEGQVLNLADLTNAKKLEFRPGVTSLTATLNADNTWTVQSSCGSPRGHCTQPTRGRMRAECCLSLVMYPVMLPGAGLELRPRARDVHRGIGQLFRQARREELVHRRLDRRRHARPLESM